MMFVSRCMQHDGVGSSRSTTHECPLFWSQSNGLVPLHHFEMMKEDIMLCVKSKVVFSSSLTRGGAIVGSLGYAYHRTHMTPP